MTHYLGAASLILTTVVSLIPATALAQSGPHLVVPAGATAAAATSRRREVPSKRLRTVRVNSAALESATIELQLFDDMHATLHRVKVRRPSADSIVWVGQADSGAQAVLTVVRGVLTGTVFADNRTFEIAIDTDGLYTVAELDPAAYPIDDPPFDGAQAQLPDAGLVDDARTSVATSDSPAGTTPIQIDVMIVWTPSAEAAQGGATAMESLALNAVANANLVYSNSGVNAQLNMVYGGAVAYTENASSISTDLNALRSTSDGIIDHVHSLRNTYGADIVTLIGTGYTSHGACGIGGLMSSVSTSFASSAFNVVDRTCAVGNLSYAHEVGHNQGLHHDPANASSTPSYPYAYGYQEPSGYFRTVLAYGGAQRVPHLSSPSIFYNGLVTGTAGQDNARALGANVSTVAAFRSVGGPTEVPPACTYAVSGTSLSFAAAGGTQTVNVTAPAGCMWNTAATGWVSLSAASGTANGSVQVTAAANTGSARSTTVTIAGTAVAISQGAAKTKGRR